MLFRGVNVWKKTTYDYHWVLPIDDTESFCDIDKDLRRTRKLLESRQKNDRSKKTYFASNHSISSIRA